MLIHYSFYSFYRSFVQSSNHLFIYLFVYFYFSFIINFLQVPVNITDDEEGNMRLQKGQSSYLCKEIYRPTAGDQNSRYKIYNEWKSWHDAKSFCELHGSHLLVICSDLEAHAVGALVLKNLNLRENYWVGFQGQKGNYTTVFSKYYINHIQFY